MTAPFAADVLVKAWPQAPRGHLASPGRRRSPSQDQDHDQARMKPIRPYGGPGAPVVGWFSQVRSSVVQAEHAEAREAVERGRDLEAAGQREIAGIGAGQ